MSTSFSNENEDNDTVGIPIVMQSENQEIICFYHRFQKVAAASFNLFSKELKILETSDNSRPDYIAIQTILRNCCYRQILVNVNIPNDLFEMMKTLVEEDRNKATLCKIPSRLFNYNDLRTVIASTKFFNHNGMNNYYLISAFNIADERLVCATGGLFFFMKTELYTSAEEISVNHITNILSNNNLWMDGETYKCLNIFDILQNPSHFLTNQDDIAAFSLYSLIERNCSFLGTSKLRHFMTTPTMNRNVLQMRHEVIHFYLQPENAETVKFMKSYIDRLSPVSMLMANVKSTAIRGKHWKKIYQNIYYSVLLAEICSENDEHVQLFSQIKNSITDEMYDMAHHLDRIIDLEKMETNEVFVIKTGVCDSLEKAKQRFHNLMKQLNSVTPFEFDCVPDFVKEVHMIHIPEAKFFLGIPYWKKVLTKEELALPGLDYAFCTNDTAYYKSKRCYELDELVGDPQTKLITEESNIIRALANYIKKNIHLIIKLIEMIGDLDCIFGMASLAKEYNYTKPLLLPDKILNIKDGTHPLLNKFDNPVMSNSISSSASDNGSLINILFGPYSSGKTVYLKQVALHAYLCHIGSFIPATKAHIGILNHIYTRTSSTESIVANSSSFMNELRRLVTIISNSSSDSLLILDEVGRGTTESEGVAIIAGSLNYFLTRGENSPHVLISTHLDSLKDYISNELLMATHEMDYIQNDVEFSFIYTVKSGKGSHQTTDDSLFPLDVPDNILITAKEVLKSLRKGKDVTPYTNLRKWRSKRICDYLKKFLRITPKSYRPTCVLKNDMLPFM